MSQSSSNYKITLGNSSLNRAKLIFTTISIIVLLILGITVYAESQTNSLRNLLTQPFQNLANSIGEAFKETPQSPNANIFETTSITISTSSSEVIINNTPVPQNQKRTYTTTKTTAPQPTKSIQEINAAADKAYQDALKKQEEWAAQQRAANDAWFEQQKAANDALYQQQSAANQQSAQDWFNQKVQEQQQNIDAWKKANGF